MKGILKFGLGAAALGWLVGAAVAQKAPASAPAAPATQILAGAPCSSVDGALVVPHAEPDHWALTGGVSLYVLRPYTEGNTGYTTTTGVGTNTPGRTETNFDWDFQAAPAVWLGMVSPGGLGARARYFNFDESARGLQTSLTPAQATTSFIDAANGVGLLPAASFGAPGIVLAGGLGTDLLQFDTSLKIHSLDAEVTQDWRCGHFSLTLSGGGRYLELDQDYTALLSNHPALAGGSTVSEVQDLAFSQRFQGGGPTLAAEGRWQVGDSGLSLFASARGTLLVGTSHVSTHFVQSVNDPAGEVGGSQLIAPSTEAHRDHVLPVAEVELGVEYARHLGRLEPFFRAAVVDQTYFDAGSGSRSDGNLSLFGAAFTLGVNY